MLQMLAFEKAEYLLPGFREKSRISVRNERIENPNPGEAFAPLVL